MVTMKDIAKEAGVSVQTISNVINNRTSQISEETRKRILKLIDSFGYRPSRIARSLKRGSTKSIGLVVPDMVFHPFYPRIFDIIESELSDRGFNILLFNTREDIVREKRAIDELIENKVDGIVFIRIIQKNSYMEKLPKGIPIVACLRAFEYLNVPSVLTNNKKVGLLATEYLVKNGHRKIVHIAGNEDLLAHRDRKIGYMEALKRNNISIDPNYIFHCDYKEKNLYNEILNFLKGIKGYTAIFAYNDIVAVNCIKALKKLGYKIPEDISIIGVDNLEIGELIWPSLTTIEQPIKKICLRTVKLLIDLIENKEKFADITKKVTMYEPKLIERDSVKNKAINT